jgi:phosphoglycerol transferase
MAAGLMHLSGHYLDWSDRIRFALALLLASVFIWFFVVRGDNINPRRWYIWTSIALVALGVWCFFTVEFGVFDWFAIYFHLAAGVDQSDAVNEYVEKAKDTALGFLLIIIALGPLLSRKPWLRNLDKPLAVTLLAVNPAVASLVWHTVISTFQEDDALLASYQMPKLASVSAAPRNLLHIVLESTEGSYFADSRYGPAMAPLQPWADRGLHLTNLHETPLTGWSVAGLTASHCGVPLFSAGMVRGNSFDRLPKFMPGAVCSGDIMARFGYDLSFMVGADPTFGGIDKLFGQHGYTNIVGLDELLPLYPNHENHWGVDDSALLANTLTTLRRKRTTVRPFGLVIETIGGHAPFGYVSRECRDRTEVTQFPENRVQAIKCTNLLVAEMLEQAEREGLLENTVVIIQGDHLAHGPARPLPEANREERRNLFIMFGPEIEPSVSDKATSPIDVFPTILEAIGLPTVDSRAGLGVSVLSDQPTLIEALGVDRFGAVIKAERALSHELWSPRAQGQALDVLQSIKVPD